MNKIISTTQAVVRSSKFFWIVVGLLIFQASWFALTARYPMAFDENFHFGIIKLFSHQWGPLFFSEPPHSAAYGDLVRSSSYLYQYLMSFPYRLIALFVHGQTAQVIILRFINIALFAGGLVAFRAVLLRLRVSRAITHVALLMLVLIPVVPFLAGQINYDNLVFLVIPLVTLLTIKCAAAIRDHGHLAPAAFIGLVSACMLASLIKYAFTPIFLALVLYLVIIWWRHGERFATLRRSLRLLWSFSIWVKISLGICLIVAGGLFIERYGVNIVEYHSLQPKCDIVRGVDECSQYGPWARNYQVKQVVKQSNGVLSYDPNPALFMPAWIQGMMHRLYFAINYNYVNYSELPVVFLTAYFIGAMGLVLCFVFWRRVFGDNHRLLLPVLITAIYCLSLLYDNLSGYRTNHVMQAINGRYLILILPFFFAFAAMAFSAFFNKVAKSRAVQWKVGLLIVTLLLTLQGAGLLTYIVRSDTSWYWPNQTVIDVNTDIKNAITPLVVGAGNRSVYWDWANN